ncbi:hypothetical protein [Vagococcus fluvialis]|uniref:hypothetical protein n=2 Tax=Vagococcus fluvialis TaxID=2738 RepID=UPI001D09A8FD|nr:hypothetical protein [Vagococcus fluvialis]UDM71137.1 hypothetical protein K5L00_13700 [Vagococcus fluvialis]UDM75996.1 hypothetical protein K5K98_09235 [Vagococcus fluvialis]
MSIKQVKTIKIVRTILLTLFFYFMWNRDVGFVITILTIICAGSLGETLPKEYKVGNTFLDNKLRWLEVTIEVMIPIILGVVLSIIL